MELVESVAGGVGISTPFPVRCELEILKTTFLYAATDAILARAFAAFALELNVDVPIR